MKWIIDRLLFKDDVHVGPILSVFGGFCVWLILILGVLYALALIGVFY